MKVVRKRWKDLVRAGEWLHLARFRFRPERVSTYHDHDFAEVFWLEDGVCEHRINGTVQRLGAGEVVLIRPEDRHVLRAVEPEGFALVNLAFDRRVYRDLLRRHGEAVAALHAPKTRLPVRVTLTTAQRAELAKSLEELARAGRGRLALEHFLSGLYLLLGSAGGRETVTRVVPPDWLRVALEQVREPGLFQQGAAGLVKAAGRSAEHVARVTRAVFDLTPSDLVNGVRMEHAARELRGTTRPIVDIALECGIGNLSHFYALFRAAHGTTPRQYRVRHLGQVV
ncbi:MAG: AraC family transcriptional regulator [Verrucomicrobiota bacterium]